MMEVQLRTFFTCGSWVDADEYGPVALLSLPKTRAIILFKSCSSKSGFCCLTTKFTIARTLLKNGLIMTGKTSLL